MRKLRKIILGGLSAGALLSSFTAASLSLTAKADTADCFAAMFSVENGTIESDSLISDGTDIRGAKISAERNGCRLNYNYTVYIGDNTISDPLCTVGFGDDSVVRLEITVTDDLNPNNGFRIFLGRRAENGVLTDSYYASAGKLGEATAGYAATESGIAVNDGDFVLDGTQIGYTVGQPISLIYDSEEKDVYVSAGTEKRLVRSLNGYSDVTDAVDFEGFANGEAKISVCVYNSVSFRGKVYSSGKSASYVLTELDGKNIVDETEEESFVVSEQTQAYMNTVYRLPMPQKFSLLNGKRDAEGFSCVVKKMSQKPFNGKVTADSGFVTETGTYTVTYYDPAGKEFRKYSLPTAAKTPTQTEIVLLSSLPSRLGLKEYVVLPLAHTKNEGYLNGYSDKVSADVYLNGELLAGGLNADGKSGFEATSSGTYKIVFRAVDLFGRQTETESEDIVADDGIYFECKAPVRYMFAGTDADIPSAKAYSSGNEKAVSRTLYSPDGRQVFSDDGTETRRETLSDTGTYLLLFSSESGGKTYTQSYEIDVHVRLSDLFGVGDGAGIYPGTVRRKPAYGDGSVYTGVGIYASESVSTFSYKGDIFIADNTSEVPLIEFMPLMSQGGKAGLKAVTVRLTDVSDSENYVDIRIAQSDIGNYSYVQAGGRGQDLLGINKGELTENEGTHLPFGLSDGDVAGGSSYRGKYTSVKLYYDDASGCVYVSPYRFNADGDSDAPILVRNLKDPEYGNVNGISLTGKKFEGFRSKAVRMEITAESADGENLAGLMVLSLDGQSFDGKFGRTKTNAAPAGFSVSDNVLLGQEYYFPVPKIYDILETELAFGGEYVVYKDKKQVYRGNDEFFIPAGTGKYTVFYCGLKDGYGKEGAVFSCDFNVYAEKEINLVFANDAFASQRAEDYLTKEGIEIGAEATSNLNRDGNVPLSLEIYKGDRLIKTIENLSPKEKFLFGNSGEYRLEYSGADRQGNEIRREILLDVVRIRAELKKEYTLNDKWVLGEKRPPFTVEKANLNVRDGLLGDMTDSPLLDIGISVLFAGRELFSGDSYSFGNESEKGEYTVTYNVSYTTDGVLNRQTIVRKIVISDDDIAPEIFCGRDGVAYEAGAGELKVSLFEATAEDNKDTIVSLGAPEFSFGAKEGDESAAGWRTLSENEDISLLFDRAGTYTVRFSATDEAGNTGYKWVLIDAIDFSAPEIELETSPEDISGAKVIETLSEKSVLLKALTGAEIVLPAARVSDIGFSPVDYGIYVKLLNGATETDASETLRNGVFTPSVKGKYVVEYKAEDSAGFTDKSVLVFDVRDYWLEASLTAENPVTEVTGKQIVLSGVSVTDYSGNAVEASVRVIVKNGDKIVYEGDRLGFEATEAGTYSVLYVIGKGGEETELENLMTIVDGIRPVITGKPIPKRYKKGQTIDVSGFAASDDPDGELQVTVIVMKDGKTVAVKDGKFVATGGKYKITVRAADYTGNVAEVTYETVQSNAGLIAGVSAGAAVVVLGGVAAIITIKRRRKHETR